MTDADGGSASNVPAPVSSENKPASHLEQASEILTNYVVPIYFDDWNDRPVQEGTGFFVRVGNQHFFVTAAHVLDKRETTRLYYYIAPNVTRHLSDEDYLTTRGSAALRRADDPLDVAVVRLGQAVPPYREVQKLPFDIHQLMPRALPRGASDYIVVGFPETRNRPNHQRVDITARAYAYHNGSAHDDAYARLGLAPASHLLLKFDAHIGFKADGSKVQFPKPQGMSGSPIWRFQSEQQTPWDTYGFPAVAIATAHLKNERMMQGTDISVAIDLIGRLLR